MENTKQERVLEIFFRSLRGENLSIREMADEYGVSTKSITRSLNDLKVFLADHPELVGNTELKYSYQNKCYQLYMDEFLSSKELFSILEVLIGAKAFSRIELLAVISKLKQFTTAEDRKKLNEMISREIYHYAEVKHDCDSVQDMLWQLVTYIHEKREISIDYYRTDRSFVNHRLYPASVLFADYYFYLIAFDSRSDMTKALYFRVDRIKNITAHRKKFIKGEVPDFDEGLLQKRSLLMWPGKLRTIRFEFTGPSVQAVLDKLPTAKVIERSGRKYLLEAEVYGDGIKMWLLSQGAWVKVVAPQEFVEEMRTELKKMCSKYEEK